MSDWSRQIPQCFGHDTLMFAGTEPTLENAIALRAEIRREAICPELLVSAIEDWLHTETSNTGQLFEQMARVRSFFCRKPACT